MKVKDFCDNLLKHGADCELVFVTDTNGLLEAEDCDLYLKFSGEANRLIVSLDGALEGL